MNGSILRRNVELKARCADLAAARRAAEEIGAEFVEVLEQRDTYFVVPQGRLKLRECAGRGAELIGYARGDRAAARGSDYRITVVSDPDGLRSVLEAALGVRGEVVKRRELWMLNGVRIHLDQVKELGEFIEFEAVMEAGEDDAIGLEKLAQLRRAFLIRDDDLVGNSYSDLAGI
jgi:predicted adenylyl cyclase CyaB